MQVLEWCLALGVRCLSVYAFSTENFKRTAAEVQVLFTLAEARGLLRTSTRPTLSRRNVCMSNHPEGKSRGHVRSRLESSVLNDPAARRGWTRWRAARSSGRHPTRHHTLHAPILSTIRNMGFEWPDPDSGSRSIL